LKIKYEDKFNDLIKSNIELEETLRMYEEQLNLMMKEMSEMEVALRKLKMEYDINFKCSMKKSLKI
jgi:hypothetical protein